MKFYLTIILSLLFAPIISLAALDVTFSGTQTVTVDGVNLTVSDSANVDQIIVNSSSLDVVLSPGASVTFTSSDRRDFTVSPYTFVTSETCGSSNSTLTLEMSSGYQAGTVSTSTITLSSSACSGGGGGGGGSSGGGGGGGGGSAPAPQYVVIPGTDSPSSQTTTTTTITPPVQSSVVSITLTKVLKTGSDNSEVKDLQKLLNSLGYTISDSGAGSPGNETSFYGAKTREAVKKFQCDMNIVCSGSESTTGYGLVGPSTRAKLNAMAGGANMTTSTSGATVTKTVSTPSGVTITLTKVLKTGSDNSEVKDLQKLLNSLGYTISDSGAGSPGNETSFYGAKTREAVKKFQCDMNIVCSGSESTTGYGLVGPSTRAKLNAMGSSGSSGQNSSGAQSSSSSDSQDKQVQELQKLLDDLMKQMQALQNS